MHLCLIFLFALWGGTSALAQESASLTPAQHYEAALEHRQAAAGFIDAGDTPSAISALEAALFHQPGHGSILVNLAILSARMGDMDTAEKWLTEVNRLGLSYPTSALAAAMPEDARNNLSVLLQLIEENGAPTGTVEALVTIPYLDILIESVAKVDSTWYVSGIAQPGLYRLDDDTLENLLEDKSIGSVFEIVAADGLIWAATAIVPQTAASHRKAGTVLLAIDPQTEQVIYRFEAPANNAQITDLAHDEDIVYFTDQAGGAIYKADIETGELTTVVAPGTFASLQGITVSHSFLYAADYATGIWRVDLSTGTALRLMTDNASLIGIDGLTADGNGGLVAIRNGARPHGVLHLSLTENGSAIETVTPLATGMPEFDDPTLGFVRDGQFAFIANSQWPSFPEDGSAPESPRKPVLIMATPLPTEER
ncbi:hypothetical protein FF098_003310 [Parvularcula flava]|uniref:Tetratricopeptide repeat protein n=1 Tax=Aquisalinus luteolus TaxID=1566827 RepID=A0A8J3EQ45_9PROT|nr:tetratricopeptide repeat protein [Aquisalinus luteolus]NHK26936.1 hypothetical protein [Aquisalinus luteolus]GGH93863.1 hypothetical protein GCM10011355_06700 [Aquisalinus luteolus]